MQKPANPQGTRDFGPKVMRKRTYILDTIKKIFIKYGFEHLETPALEKLDTLEGKYGEEGDKLLYKIRSNRALLNEIDGEKADKLNDIFPNKWIPGDSKLGLRYDLTVPFARFVVQHRNDLTFPFRRYQIQPVWRADRPQKGRFREFTQCDADCIGSRSLIHEADLVKIYSEALFNLGLENAVVKLNHRKFLEALVDELNLDFPVERFTSTLDKLDKIGEEGVSKELVKNGVSKEKCKLLFSLIDSVSLNSENITQIAESFGDNPYAKKAVDELEELLSFIEVSDLKIDVQLDLSLARGLDYYTGCIFEAIVPDSGIGSISGGGRYDNLTGVFGLKDVSGVGISFGVDRIYEILESQNKWPQNLQASSTVVICHFDKKSMLYANNVAFKLRLNNVPAIVYPDSKKINKQFDFANKTGARFAVVIGESEIKSKTLSVKDLVRGTQESLTMDEAIKRFNL